VVNTIASFPESRRFESLDVRVFAKNFLLFHEKNARMLRSDRPQHLPSTFLPFRNLQSAYYSRLYRVIQNSITVLEIVGEII
jgi:hypothetical protein